MHQYNPASRPVQVPKHLPRLAALFSTGSYSTWYDPKKVVAKGHPNPDYYRASHKPVTMQHWIAHHDGRRGLTLPPNRDDGTVTWIAIDLDVYDMDLAAWARTIERRNLPLVPVRSKSGGGHAFGFLESGVAISEGRLIASAFLRQLGLPNETELFPCNWDVHPKGINMPYLGFTNDIVKRQVGIRSNGLEMGLLEFVRACERKRMSLDQITNLVRPQPVSNARSSVVRPRAAVQQIEFIGPFPNTMNGMMLRDAYAGKGRVVETYAPDKDPGLKVDCALKRISPDLPYDDAPKDQPTWFKLACALVDNFTFEEGFPIMQRWCNRALIDSHKDENRNEAAWHRLNRRSRSRGDISLRTIYKFADEAEKPLDPPPAESWRAMYWRLLAEKSETSHDHAKRRGSSNAG